MFPTEPETYRQTISFSEKGNWFQAIQDELKSSSDSNTWTSAERPIDKNVAPGNYDYQVKLKAEGNLEKYRQSCVASRSYKKENYEYFKPFAPKNKQKHLDSTFLAA